MAALPTVAPTCVTSAATRRPASVGMGLSIWHVQIGFAGSGEDANRAQAIIAAMRERQARGPTRTRTSASRSASLVATA
jgi:hypothetical protein